MKTREIRAMKTRAKMINKKASMEIMIMKKKTWDNKKILPKKKMR